MSNAPGSLQISERMRDQAIAALVPLFIDGPSGDIAAARAAVVSILDDYHAATPMELQLATQIIAFSWATMACLRTAAAAKNLSMDEVRRFQSQAIALDRTAQKATKLLDALRKQKAKDRAAMPPETIQWDEGGFQLAINQATEKLNRANATLSAHAATTVLAEQKTKLPIGFAEPMTRSVLARRKRMSSGIA